MVISVPTNMGLCSCLPAACRAMHGIDFAAVVGGGDEHVLSGFDAVDASVKFLVAFLVSLVPQSASSVSLIGVSGIVCSFLWGGCLIRILPHFEGNTVIIHTKYASCRIVGLHGLVVFLGSVGVSRIEPLMIYCFQPHKRNEHERTYPSMQYDAPIEELYAEPMYRMREGGFAALLNGINVKTANYVAQTMRQVTADEGW